MLSHVHHLTFVVRDLDTVVRRYESAFRLGPFQRENLPARGVVTARARVGEAWLVFVQPTDETSEPARHLARHGEGLLLLSFGVDDLDQSIHRLRATDCPARTSSRRRGISDWEVVDLEQGGPGRHGLQLTAKTSS